MAGTLARRLEDNLAAIYGRGMAPFVLRRALRRMNREAASLTDADVTAVVREIEGESLERIFGANARGVAAEIVKHVASGTVVEAEVVRGFRTTGAMDRLRELI